MNTQSLIENIDLYCKMKQVPPTKACIESGAGRSFISNIKKGQIPSIEKVQMLAGYLEVTTSQLLGEKEPPVNNDERQSADAREDKINLANSLYEQLSPENKAKADSFAKYLLAEQEAQKGKK